MSPILLILVLAVVVGFAAGGTLRNFEALRVNWWVLAFAGVALQTMPLSWIDMVPPRLLGTGALLASYALLLAFIAVNRWIPGARVMALGLLLNMLVVGLNAGMPVSASAIEAAGGSADRPASTKHHLETQDDMLVFLGDVIPVPEPVGIVVSVGDVLLYAGMAWFVIQVMRGRSRENPRPLAVWFLTYRGKHAPSHWRVPTRYRSRGHAEAGSSGSEP